MTNKELVFERLVADPLPTNQYMDESINKKSICLHHTGGRTAQSAKNTWLADSQPVATCVAIERDGKIIQYFPSDRWAFSLGLDTANYRQVEKQTIAIEICSYGWLKKRDGQFFNAYGEKIDFNEVYEHNTLFRGVQYFHKYTDEQIESVRRLLLYWSEKYNIPLTYHPNMWQLNEIARGGGAGVWTHVSYRNDKTDCFPQPELINMLKSLHR